jgi:hypothetical protein
MDGVNAKPIKMMVGPKTPTIPPHTNLFLPQPSHRLHVNPEKQTIHDDLKLQRYILIEPY